MAQPGIKNFVSNDVEFCLVADEKKSSFKSFGQKKLQLFK